MNRPQNQGEMMSAAQTQISSVYSRAIVQTASHYQTMTAFVAAVLSSCGASEFFSQDSEEVGGEKQ